VVLAGWASNSKYSLLGGLRAAAQMLTYDVFMGLSLMGVVMLAGSFDLVRIVEAQKSLWFCVPQVFGLAVFFMAGVAEAHRSPFDLPEADAELVAGYHSEYSGMKFGDVLCRRVSFDHGDLRRSSPRCFFGGWLGPGAAARGLVSDKDVFLHNPVHPPARHAAAPCATTS